MSEQITCNLQVLRELHADLVEAAATYEEGKANFKPSSSTGVGYLLQFIDESYNEAADNFRNYLTMIDNIMKNLSTALNNTVSVFESCETSIISNVNDQINITDSCSSAL